MKISSMWYQVLNVIVQISGQRLASTTHLGVDKHGKDAESLDKYSSERWEILLHFLVGSPSVVLSGDLRDLMLKSGLMRFTVISYFIIHLFMLKYIPKSTLTQLMIIFNDSEWTVKTGANFHLLPLKDFNSCWWIPHSRLSDFTAVKLTRISGKKL